MRDAQSEPLVSGAEAASRDYDLERFTGAAPAALLDDLVLLREAINDSPERG